MGTKGFLLVDLTGLKENSKGEELFLVGGLMLFGGWHAPKCGSGEPLNVIYAVQTFYAPSLTNTDDPAPSCAGYSVPMKDCVGGRRGGGFWVTLPVLWGSAAGSTMTSPLSTPPAASRPAMFVPPVPPHSQLVSPSRGEPQGRNPSLFSCNAQQGLSHCSDSLAFSWSLLDWFLTFSFPSTYNRKTHTNKWTSIMHRGSRV